MEKSDAILEFINANDGCVKEYTLMQWLDKNHPNFYESLGDSPSLYKKHFLLFYHLYHLNDELNKKNLHLIISPLEIRIVSSNSDIKSIGKSDHLKAFYLDENNLLLSQEEVNQMLQDFWEKYLALDQKSEALRVLQLEGIENLDKHILKKKFNQLAQTYHPDKGGDEDKFIQLKEAYNSLKIIL